MLHPSPGPWVLREHGWVDDAEGNNVALLPRRRDDRGDANARLIAAAPELGALLDEVFEECDDLQDWKRRARAALRKAGLR